MNGGCKMKKFLSLILVLLMVLGLVACGSTTDNNDNGDDSGTIKLDGSYPSKTVKIGVEIYDPTDAEFLEVKEYFDNYLAKSFNVEFVYSEAIQSAEQELQFIENSAVSGCVGIIGYYNVSGQQVVQETLNNGMFYWGAPDDEELYEAFKDNEYYLGGLTYGEGNFDAGNKMAKFVMEQGATNIVYASGGANFGVPMFVERREGFLAAVKEAQDAGKAIEVIDVSGFPGDSFFADQAAALSKDIDAVCASFNGVDFWAQPIASAGKADTVPLATIGSLNKDFLTAFENGSISYLLSTNIQRFGIGVGMIINAVDGNAAALKEDGLATNKADGYWEISSAQDCAKILEIQTGAKVYTAEDIASLIQNYNADASSKTIDGLIEKGTIDSILAR